MPSVPARSRASHASPVVVHKRWCVSVLAHPEDLRRLFPRYASAVDATIAAGRASPMYFEADIGAQFYPKTGRVKVWQSAKAAAREDVALQRMLADALLAASRSTARDVCGDDEEEAGA